MTKRTVIFLHLGFQILIGLPVMMGLSEAFGGSMLGGMGLILGYVIMSLVFVLLSQILYRFTKNENLRDAFRSSRSYTIALWLTVPFLITLGNFIVSGIENKLDEVEGNKLNKI